MRKRGFTLVELIIVVAIIGILVSVAVPKFSSAIQAAKDRSIEAEARLLAQSIVMHSANGGGRLAWHNQQNFVTKYLPQSFIDKYDYKKSKQFIHVGGVGNPEKGKPGFMLVYQSGKSDLDFEIYYFDYQNNNAYSGSITIRAGTSKNKIDAWLVYPLKK